MSSDDATPSPRALFFTREFKRNLRQLARKYRRIKTDIQPVVTELEAGTIPRDRIPGVPVEVYKVRARNSDSARGKSGGYRIIYQITAENAIILITIYSKTEQTDISPQQIHDIILAYQDEQEDTEEKRTGNDQPSNEKQGEQQDTAQAGHKQTQPNEHTEERG